MFEILIIFLIIVKFYFFYKVFIVKVLLDNVVLIKLLKKFGFEFIIIG